MRTNGNVSTRHRALKNLLILNRRYFGSFPVIYILTSIGMIKPTILAQQWRLAIVIIAIISAAITPTIDPVTMGLTMLPMIVLYFASIGLSYLAYAGRRKRVAEAVAAESNQG